MDLEQFIEQAAKPGPEGVVGRVLEKRFARELKTYFKKLGSDILAMKLEDLAGAGTTEAIARHQVAMRIQRANRVNQPVLLGILRHHIEAGHNAGQKQDVLAEAEELLQEWPDADGNDDHGREDTGFYHGTSGRSARAIANNGLKVPKDGELFGSKNKVTALTYARVKSLKSGSRTAAVVHLKQDPFEKNSVLFGRHAGSTTKDIDKSNISHVEIFKTSDLIGKKESEITNVKPIRVLVPGKSRLHEADDQKKPADKLGQTGQDAADYAAESAGELITGLEQTTIDDIADAVATGIEDRLGVPATAGLIKDIVDGMSTLRAETIAATEMADAFGEAMLEKIGDLGFEYKRLVLSEDACPICEENADADPLPVDDDYPSGDQRPPFHPNCRCAIVAARGPDESESDS